MKQRKESRLGTNGTTEVKHIEANDVSCARDSAILRLLSFSLFISDCRRRCQLVQLFVYDQLVLAKESVSTIGSPTRKGRSVTTILPVAGPWDHVLPSAGFPKRLAQVAVPKGGQDCLSENRWSLINKAMERRCQSNGSGVDLCCPSAFQQRHQRWGIPPTTARCGIDRPPPVPLGWIR